MCKERTRNIEIVAAQGFRMRGSRLSPPAKMNDPTQFEQTLVVVQNGWGHFMPELLALQGVQAFLYFMSCVT